MLPLTGARRPIYCSSHFPKVLQSCACATLWYRAGKIASEAEFKEVVSLLGVDAAPFEEVNLKHPAACSVLCCVRNHYVAGSLGKA